MMTPKEKAGELYFKYHNLWINGNSIIAKVCASIAVDEIIEILWHTHKNEIEYRYFQEVKQEIEKL